MPDTPLLALPMIAASQAQKHVTHNEALLRLDALVQISVVTRQLSSPPLVTHEGVRYLLPASPSGAWAGQGGKLALFQGGVWNFITPRKGWCAWVEGEGRLVAFDGTTWRDPVIFPDATTAPRLGINTTADFVNRLAVAAPGSVFTHSGNDHRLKINKHMVNHTASLLFQSNWMGRAELGLTGNDDFTVKVSATGMAWKDALLIDRVTGAVSLPNTPPPPFRRLFNQSLASQGPGFAADTYLAGSAITMPPEGVKAGTRYTLVFDVSKTAAGVAAPVLRLRFGPSASLADPLLGELLFPPQTAAADDGRFMLDVTFRSAGAGTAAVVQAVGCCVHGLAATGLSTASGPVRRATSAGFDSAVAGSVMGVSVNAGAAAAWTVSLVQASLENAA